MLYISQNFNLMNHGSFVYILSKLDMIIIKDEARKSQIFSVIKGNQSSVNMNNTNIK